MERHLHRRPLEGRIVVCCCVRAIARLVVLHLRQQTLAGLWQAVQQYFCASAHLAIESARSQEVLLHTLQRYESKRHALRPLQGLQLYNMWYPHCMCRFTLSQAEATCEWLKIFTT